MPTLDTFPKAHQVTFKYYVGVIYFLEENYEEVRQRNMSNLCQDANPPSVREAPYRSLANVPQRRDPQQGVSESLDRPLTESQPLTVTDSS
jgi:hypothetical protein